jgi:hypothetical protein
MDGAPVASINAGPESPGIPNPDAIQENRVQSWIYDAGSGRYAGANIGVVTKSGSNAFHGTIFEFVRNDIFNSNDFFLKRAGLPEPVLKQNQFGFSLGGPIKKNKLFFFGSYQGTTQRNGLNSAGFAPNVTLPPLPTTRTADAAGAYAVGQALCPASHPGDRRYETFQANPNVESMQVACDGSNINQVALKVLNLKLPNGSYAIPGSNTNDFATVPYTIPAKFREDQFLVNTDYVITSKHTIAERFFFSHDPQTSNFTGMGNSLPGFPADNLTENIYAVVKLASTLTSNLSNELRISGQHDLSASTPLTTFTNKDVGITSVVSQIDMIDIMNIVGMFNWGGIGSWDNLRVNQYQLSDQISWIHGKNTIRAGFEADRRQWNTTVVGDAVGALTFMSFDDFLLGLPGCSPSDSTCSTANPGNTNGSAVSNVYGSSGPAGVFATVNGPDGINHAYRFSDYAGFVQDDFKLASHLTLNLGVRWEYFSLPSDNTGDSTNFWPGLAEPWVIPEGNDYMGFVVPSNYKGDLPTDGGVYRNTSKTPLSTGAPLTNLAPRVGFAWQPLGSSRLAVRGGYGIFNDRPIAFSTVGSSATAVPYAGPVGGAGTANYQASLAIPFPSVESGWGSPRWVDFTSQASSNLNLRMLDENFSNPQTQKWNLEIQQQLPYNLILALGYAGAHSIHLQNTGHAINESMLASAANPVNGITVNTVKNAPLRVPYLGIAPNGLDDQETGASAKYNSLQATLMKQLSHGVQLQAAYTFSKTLSTVAIAPTPTSGMAMNSNDPLNARQQYGPSFAASPQRLSVNYSWELPYKGAGTKGKLLGGWSASGMTIIQNGTPMTFSDNRGGSIYGNAGTSRAQFCPGMGVGNIATSGSVKDRLNAFFNKSAFCAPPAIWDGIGTDQDNDYPTIYGNTSVGMILGPGQDNTDLSVNKSIAIKESKMELRMELFNAFNHPQFSTPDTGVTDPTFGEITSSSVNPRLIQFALKYSF